MSTRFCRDALAACALLAALIWNVQKEEAFRWSRGAFAEVDDALVAWAPPAASTTTALPSPALRSTTPAGGFLGNYADAGVHVDMESGEPDDALYSVPSAQSSAGDDPSPEEAGNHSRNDKHQARILPAPGSVVRYTTKDINAEPLKDPDFGIVSPRGLRLERRSELCQWVERRERRCQRKGMAQYLLELFVAVLVDVIIMTLIGRVPSTTSTFGVPDLNTCWTEYLFNKSWVTSGWVDYTRFHRQSPEVVNPHPRDWPNATDILPEAAHAGGLRLGSGLIRTLGKTATAVLVFGARDCAVSATNQSALWMCGQQVSPLRHGFRYQGSGWFVSEFNRSNHSDDDTQDCRPGDVRVRYLVRNPQELTVLGLLDANGTVDIFPLRTPETAERWHTRAVDANRTAGFLEEDGWTVRELFNRGLGEDHSHCRHSRVCLLLALTYAFFELRHRGPPFLAEQIRSLARLAVLLLVPICVFAAHLGLQWTLLYGLGDWRGQETSRPQLALLVVATSMLIALGKHHEALTASLEQTSLVARRLVLLRVNASFFRVLAHKVESSPSRRSACVARLALAAAIVAATALAWLGLMDGATDLTGQSTSRLELTLIAAAAVAAVAAVAAATVAEVPQPSDVSGLLEAGDAGNFTTFDCPICLESTNDGLVLSPCGHTICVTCWPDLRARSRRCAQCRRWIDSAVAIDRRIDACAGQFEGVTQL